MVFIPIYSKETALYDTLAIKNDIDAAGNKADAYMTDVSGGGVMVHPKNDSSSGWRIASALELLKDGVSYIKAWLAGTSPNQVPTVQIGVDNGGHTTIDSNGMRVYAGNGTSQLANIGYGEGNDEGEQPRKPAPYFSFGTRSPGSDIGNYSFSEGGNNIASGYVSHAEGKSTRAIGDCAHAEGCETEAHGMASHASGEKTYADQDNQFVVGRYNKKTPSGQTYEDSLFVVGCGESEATRANAFEVKQNPLGTSADDRLPKIKVSDLAPFKLIKAHSLETTQMLPDSYTANDVKHEITSLVPDEYEVLNVTVSGTGYNSVNVYRLTWLWENNKLYIAYRLRRFSTVPETGNISVTPYVNIILINKGLL